MLHFQLPQTNLVVEEQIPDRFLQALRAGFEHGDAQIRAKPGEFVGGINAAGAGADDNNVKIHGDLPKMTRVFINKDQSVVFEFAESVKKETAERLEEILKSLGRVEFTNPEISGKRVGFDIEMDSYTEPECDTGNIGDVNE